MNAPALSRLEARHAQAISSLVREWRPLTGDDPIATRALNALSAAYPVVDQEPIERQPPSYVDSFQSEFDSLSEKFAALGRDLSDAMSVIGDGDVRDHDGLVEFVSATWASVRARRVDIGDVRARMSAFIEDSQHPQRDRLTVGELVHQIDERVRSLHQRKTELRERGFTVREVSLGLEGDDDSSSEGEWEDAVDISVEKTNATEEDILPEVTDWAKVMRGEEGQDTNRLILESLERRSADTERSKRSAENSMGGMGIDQAEIARGRGPGSSRVRGRGRGRGHGRGAGRGRRQLTARERISKKLGLKKIKKKSLLDDL